MAKKPSKPKGFEEDFNPENFWTRSWNFPRYGISEGKRYFKPLLDTLDRQGKLGKNIIDAGGGPEIQLDVHTPVNADYFSPLGKQVVNVDIGASMTYKKGNKIILKADLSEAGSKSLKERRAIASAARLLGLKKEELKSPFADSIILSDILNYVNYREVITGLLNYLKPGGRMIIRHCPDNGILRAFHGLRPRDNIGLARFLKAKGLELEHIAHAVKKYPTIQNNTELHNQMYIHIVARKPIA